ncbi:MAG: SGNH/GDSL hydrolase family protein [Catonella sp.]|nr:SGNH/GDSL hydrolase family protein [Catonella sp.]MDY6357274.1 SGNH/GDSL hydrolase family protein [Catonella sp.]
MYKDIEPGNASEYDVENLAVNPISPLIGKRVIFLGSSVTYGAAAGGTSFVEYLEAIDGIIAVKEAVSGTTLATGKAESYVERIKRIPENFRADAFICQLSTNDAGQDMAPLGHVVANEEECNTATVAGAIQYIISFARKTWGCPVIFYTNSRFESEKYQKMVELLHKIAKQDKITVLDLYNDSEMLSVNSDDYALYMHDSVHPTKAGYLKWWTGKFEDCLRKV